MKADRCAICGAVIPEGRMICPKCEYSPCTKRKPHTVYFSANPTPGASEYIRRLIARKDRRHD